MNSQPEDSYGYPTDTDARQPMDDAGEELAEGPYGNFDVVELEVLAQRRKEWTQVGKREKPSIMWEICNEFAKMEKHHDLRLVEWQEKEEVKEVSYNCPLRYKYSMQSVVWELYHDQIQLKHANMKSEGRTQATKHIDLYQQALSAFIHEDLTDEQQQAADDIMDKWNGSQGPTPEVQAWNAKKYGLKYMQNFAEEMWQYCRMRIVSLTGWKNEEGIIQSYCMDFNNDIRGSSNFDNIHTISASWREYLGNAYEDPDIDAGGQVPNMAANHPRAKMGDPVKVVTNDKGDIRIGNLNGHNHDSILQMVCGYLTVHYYTEDVAIHKMNIVELSSRGKSHDPRCSHKKTPMPVRQPTQLATDDEEQHEVMSTEDEVAGNEALPVVKQPSTSWQSTIQHKGSQVTAELPDTSGYIDDDKFDSMPFTDVCTTQSGPSGQHHKGGKLKSALKHHVRCEQNNVEPQPNLKTSSNPQQSIAKATKRHQAANDHPSPPGPSTEEVPNEVQPWKSP
ncbi:hypothetical protein EDD16DRAFT_1716028 [Pisolithus croceorrhizus]|nr:hypothetical protein EDD16DRAFT_1716028 [Pisolithus croceorrhizus]